jgi:Arc/MetJ-type ribon-helix-helix transcriptional regulator
MSSVARAFSEDPIPNNSIMAHKSVSSWAPLTFDLTEPQVTKIEKARRALRLRTASEVVRLAISNFDFSTYQAKRPPHQQISVRVAPDLRSRLRRHAKLKNVSIGELLRVALDSFSPAQPTARRGKAGARSNGRRR